MEFDFGDFTRVETLTKLADPESYRGLYAFHKYWGKKPAEPIAYLIANLSPENGLVFDPFLGSGVSAREATQLARRFIGIDVNPCAIRLSRLLVTPPVIADVEQSLAAVAERAEKAILDSYATSDGKVASHYVWEGPEMKKVWCSEHGSRQRIENPPSAGDLSLFQQYSGYQSRRIRSPRFFTNSRINSESALTLSDLFTPRALRNIDVLIDAIRSLPDRHQEAMLLALTAASGQMSKMVFAITGRGKAKGKDANRMEVGSWVIGYWRPNQHFEVNVWHTYERRVRKLIKALGNEYATQGTPSYGSVNDVVRGTKQCALVNADCLQMLANVEDASLDLVITDPPHSDRIPYLELSEMWNAILGERPSFDSEIIVSNAKERGKTKKAYEENMRKFLNIAGVKLRANGSLVLFFNAKSKSSWRFLTGFSSDAKHAGLNYRGCFPLVYSATSVVQDNRDGALKTDYGLIFSPSAQPRPELEVIPGWSSELPRMAL